jgi:hypothetical protein
MMRPMQLDRSRTALRQATQAVEELRAAKNSPDLFRDKFPLAMGAVQRVGSVIDHETKGHRTPAFGKWWEQTKSEPMLVFMRDVRNAEFKRGERRQRATHYGRAELRIEESFSARGEVRGADGRSKGGRSSAAPSPEPPSRPPPTATKTTDWHFTGGLYEGQEILPLLDSYLVWLREDVLPTPERLTR